MQMNYLSIFSVRPEAGSVAAATNHPHAEYLLVERDRAIEVGDLQSHSAEVCRFRKSISPRTDSMLRISRHQLPCSHALSPSSSLFPLPSSLFLFSLPASRFPLPASLLRLGAFTPAPGPECLDRGEGAQKNENRLRSQCLDARINPHRLDMGSARDHRDRYDGPFLQLANPFAHEHERHVEEKETGDGEEWTHWNSDAVAIEQSEDDREHSKSDNYSQ